MKFDGMFLYFPLVVYSQRITVSGDHFFKKKESSSLIYDKVAVTIASGMDVYLYHFSLLSKSCPWVRAHF